MYKNTHYYCLAFLLIAGLQNNTLCQQGNGIPGWLQGIGITEENFEKVARVTAEVGRDLARGVGDLASDVINAEQNAYERNKRSLEYRLDSAESKEVRAQIELELLQLEREHRQHNNKMRGIEADAVDFIAGAPKQVFGMLQEEQRAQQQRETAIAVEAVRWQSVARALIQPKTPLLALGVSGAVFAGKKSSELLLDELHAYWSAPELAQESSLLSPTAKFYNFFWQIKPEPAKVSDVILEPKTRDVIHTIASSVKYIARRHENFQNVLLYGPAGTGKTMLAKRIARESGLDYIYFAASDIDQFGLAEALQLINRLFIYARNSTKKLMIIIDECEVLFCSRSNANMSEQTRKVLTKFLAQTGTKNPDFMIVGLTNRIQDFDEASLSRFDERIKIDVPGENERRLLIGKYVHDYIITARAIRPVYPSIIARLFGKKPSKPRAVSVMADLLDTDKRGLREDIMDELTHKLAGFPGREIEAFANKVRQTVMASKEGILTQEILDKVVARSVEAFKLASSCTAAHTI